ncbi:unnamed protein product, partial [Prorocentrum cordatum]
MVKVDSTKTCGTRIEPDSLDSECVDGLMMLGDANDKEDRNTSLHSVCKAYQSADAYSPEQVSRPKALDFISLLRKHGVGTVVRTNASNEEGLREVGGSYDPAALREQSIHHLDFFVKDVNGGIPPPRLIMSFLKTCRRWTAPRCGATPGASRPRRARRGCRLPSRGAAGAARPRRRGSGACRRGALQERLRPQHAVRLPAGHPQVRRAGSRPARLGTDDGAARRVHGAGAG